jgi:adenine-specific DNA-methyltransferase
MIDESSRRPDEVLEMQRPGYSTFYLKAGKRILFYSDKLKLIDGTWQTGEPLTTLWADILSNNLHAEGSIEFPKSKKPEALIKRVLELSTNPGDLVLDSFLGSGTTAAVAHKMGRRWIGIELGEHCHTHCIPRLRKVIDGEDASGITEAVGWKGGGGFRYYRLAPSLLTQDKWGQWVISKDYNAPMLAEAVCKHENFTYAPSETAYWQHGHSTERDFIYVTTASLSHEQLQELSEEVGPDRTLLVVCSAFRGRKEGYSNLTIKKIPSSVLTRCEWGHDDYSLKVENLPTAPPPTPKTDAKTGQQSLFAEEGEA